MGLFSKPVNWVKRQTHGGLSMDGLKSTGRGVGRTLNNPVVRGLGALALTSTGIGAIPGALIMGGAKAGADLMSGRNIGEALEGGAKEGAMYGAGRAMQAGVNKIAGHFTKTAGVPTAAHEATGRSIDEMLTKNALGTHSGAQALGVPAAAAAEGNPMLGDIVSRFGGWVKDNPKDALIIGGKAAGGILENRATNKQLAMMAQRDQLEREQFEEQKRRYEEEERRRSAIGEQLSPHMAEMLRQVLARFTPQAAA